jgi:hypothetical protein
MARQNRQTLIFAIGCDQSRQHHAALPLSILLLWAGHLLKATRGSSPNLRQLQDSTPKATVCQTYRAVGFDFGWVCDVVVVYSDPSTRRATNAL